MTAPTDHLDCARLAQLLTKDMQTASALAGFCEPGEASMFTARAHLTLHTLAGAMGYDLTRKGNDMRMDDALWPQSERASKPNPAPPADSPLAVAAAREIAADAVLQIDLGYHDGVSGDWHPHRAKDLMQHAASAIRALPAPSPDALLAAALDVPEVAELVEAVQAERDACAALADKYGGMPASGNVDHDAGWDHSASLRYHLLFSLKFMLARAAIGVPTSDISEIIAAYNVSGFIGDEDQTDFIDLINAGHDTPAGDRTSAGYRQSAESIQVIAQISYLSLDRRRVTVSLSNEDALNLFEQLSPITGQPLPGGADEVFRLTALFQSATSALELDYATTAVSDVEDSGFSASTTFAEGAKSRKTHLVIERNGKIREAFFKANPSAVCDFCGTDTSASYPWTSRILDVHHLLPLCSGARTSKQGTLLDDLVAVCPTCHRGVHRYYDRWLKGSGQRDFLDADQAKLVYNEAKQRYGAA